MAYVVAASFLAITGFFFVASVSDPFSEASIRGYIAGAIFFMVFLSPALTMRLLAEEQKLGTLELLMTSPVREWEIVIGKFIAAFVMLALMVAGTFYFVVVLAWYGDPDIGPILTGYLGVLLYGAATLAIGLMASALSSNQLVSLVVGAGLLTGLTVSNFIGRVLLHVPRPGYRVVRSCGLYHHYYAEQLEACRLQLGGGHIPNDDETVADIDTEDPDPDDDSWVLREDYCRICGCLLEIETVPRGPPAPELARYWGRRT